MDDNFNRFLRLLLIAVFSGASFVCRAQSKPTTVVCAPGEIMPQFPGGHLEMYKFINRHLKHPSGIICAQGKVFVQFTVEKDGSITNVKILRGIHPAFDAEAERVVNLFPKWIPGKQCDIIVATRMVVPINFDLK